MPFIAIPQQDTLLISLCDGLWRGKFLPFLMSIKKRNAQV